MAYYNHSEAKRKEEAAENFDELKKFIRQPKSKWYYSSQHIADIENKLREQEEKLKEYRTFFNLLSKLMPKQFSIHDKIF